MRTRAVTLSLVGLAVVAVLVAPGSGATNPASRYVLTARDVGAAYKANAAVSGGRSLADITVGDSARVRTEIRRNWLGGIVAGFNSVSGKSGVISIADVFRAGSRIDEILAAWQQDAVHVLKGAFERVPAHSPGDHPALVRGKIIGYPVLVYMWSRANTIASVEVTDIPGDAGRALLLRLARQQNKKLKAP